MILRAANTRGEPAPRVKLNSNCVKRTVEIDILKAVQPAPFLSLSFPPFFYLSFLSWGKEIDGPTDWFRGFASLDRSNRCGAVVADGCCWLLGPLLLAMRGSGIDQFCAPSSLLFLGAVGARIQEAKEIIHSVLFFSLYVGLVFNFYFLSCSAAPAPALAFFPRSSSRAAATVRCLPNPTHPTPHRSKTLDRSTNQTKPIQPTNITGRCARSVSPAPWPS